MVMMPAAAALYSYLAGIFHAACKEMKTNIYVHSVFVVGEIENIENDHMLPLSSFHFPILCCRYVVKLKGSI